MQIQLHSRISEEIFTMLRLFSIVVLVSCYVSYVDPARILGVYPMPSISHQVVFRALTLELVKRGHEVVSITPNPAFKKGEAPNNLTEIDTSDGYRILMEMIQDQENAVHMKRGVIFTADLNVMNNNLLLLSHYIFQIPEVEQLIADKSQKFDLVIMEGLSYATAIFGQIYDVPIILFSSLMGTATNYEAVGSVGRHPHLYPYMFRDNFGTGFLDIIHQIFFEYNVWVTEKIQEEYDDTFLKSKFGSNAPSTAELKKRVALLLVNSHPMFDQNRPVSPATIYLGAVHMQPKKELPQDLKSYLDNSSRGIVYVSLGTNVRPSFMDKEFLDEFLDAFEKIPYDILWKFDGDSLERIPKNVKIQKWFPQRDLLDHPNIKVFVMQGGLQSTDEAIDAEVPLVGIPFLGDQYSNTHKYKVLGIGVTIDTLTMVADDLVKAVNTVANDPSYKENMKKLKAIMQDQPEKPIQRAIWWTEHVLRHKGSKHLLGAAAQMSWPDYFMFDVVIPLAIGFSFVAIIVLFVVIYTCRLVLSINTYVKVKKH